MINAYLTFCSVIYHFYVRKKEDIPVFYTFLSSTVILTANVFGIYDIIRYFFFTQLPFSSFVVFSFSGIVALLNYLLFIHHEEYKHIYPSRKQGSYSVLYIVLSIGLVICTANIHNARNVESAAAADSTAVISKTWRAKESNYGRTYILHWGVVAAHRCVHFEFY